MKNQTNREIVKLAFLMNQGSLSPADNEIFTAGLARLDSQGLTALSLAAKLLEGKRYRVTTDNPRTIDRCKSLAEYMGAVVGLEEEGEWWTSILICPSTHPLDHSQNEHH